jgi:hypothetical protein
VPRAAAGYPDRDMKGIGFIALASLAASSCGAAPSVSATDPRSPLRLERRIDLPAVKGRIDHLAVDEEHWRLFVAEYGNGSVDEVDLAAGRVIDRIDGLHEPQGIAYLKPTDEILVASGDGSVRFYAAGDRREVARLDLGDDADNVAVDGRNGHVVVGYGNGGLAMIDPVAHRILARLKLPGHPEGFALIGPRVLVNVPDRGVILAADIDSGRIEASWPTDTHRANFPLAADPSGAWFAVAYRLPAALARIDARTGKMLAIQPTCGDADGLFIEGDRIEIVCGSGEVDLVSASRGSDVRVGTAPGARTGLRAPGLHLLFVAAPAHDGPAAIWMLKDNPAR